MSFIVIWSVLKKWFSKPIGNSFGKTMLCSICIIICCGVYSSFNKIQIQRIHFFDKLNGDASLKTLDVFLLLDYNDTSSRLHYGDSIITGTTIGYQYTLENNVNTQSPDLAVGLSSYRNDIEAFKFLNNQIRQHVKTINCSYNIYSILDIEKPSIRFSVAPIREKNFLDIPQDYKFSTKHFFFNWNDRLIGDKYTDTFIYNPFSQDIFLFGHNAGYSWEENEKMLTQQTYISTNKELYSPHTYSFYDVSKFFLKLRFDLDTLSSLTLEFPGITNFTDIYPAPDSRIQSKAIYVDIEKLKHIRNYGLDVLIEFPNTRSLQDNRNTVLVFFITLFLTLLSTSAYQFITATYKHRKRIKSICHNSTSITNRPHLCYRYNIILCGCDCVTISFVIAIFVISNPCNLYISEIIFFSLIYISLFTYLRFLSILKKRHTSITINNKSKWLYSIITNSYWTILISAILWWTIQTKFGLIDSFSNYFYLIIIISSLTIFLIARHIAIKH